MQLPLINLSLDLKRLFDEGYDLEIIGGQYLAVHQIPYVNANKNINYGSLICVLTLAGPNQTARPSDHTAYFIGSTPCQANGVPLTAIINNSQTQTLATGLVVNHYFSSKPTNGGYENYYDKVRTYSEILCAQARVLDQTITSRPHRKKIK